MVMPKQRVSSSSLPVLFSYNVFRDCYHYLGNSQDGQYLRPSDPAYEQVLDSLAMIARHTPVPLLEALLRWRERWVESPYLPFYIYFFSFPAIFVLLILVNSIVKLQ